MKAPEAKQDGVYVLTFELNDYDQHGDYILTVFESLPTLQELSAWFSKHNETPRFRDMGEAVAFFEHLRQGGGRQDREDMWYSLYFVSFGERV